MSPGVRLFVRALALTLTTSVLALVTLTGMPLAWCAGRLGGWRARMTGLWGRSSLAVLRGRVEVVGAPPAGSFLLVTNHLSYVDILVLSSRVPCTFVSKAEVGSWPVLGPLSRIAGTIFIEREKRRDVVRVGRELQRALEGGRAVVFFPEGTSTSGDEVAPFRSSLLDPAARLGLPVHWAALRYETPPGERPAREAVAWWGDMEFGPHFLGLLRLSGFRARLVFGEEPVAADDRKQLASRLRQAVASGFRPMTDEARAAGDPRTSPAGS